ncbi:hypothetical protein [Nocardia salmonicida]|uniref:hypothetical protein n=1 Tax=Nocardia salmonicida TaxID=53431 RepID=UPI003412DA38
MDADDASPNPDDATPLEPAEQEIVHFSVQHSEQYKRGDSPRPYSFVAIRAKNDWYTSRVEDRIDIEEDQHVRWGVRPVTDWREITDAAFGPIEVATAWRPIGNGKGLHTRKI